MSHDQIEAMTMADKIVVMNAGRVEQIGTPLELYDRPDNLFVATFTGSPAMNIFPAKVTQTGVKIAGVAEIPNKLDLVVGRDISYGIRPDDIVIGGGGAIPVDVLVVEPTGSETHVTASLAGHELTIISKERLSTRPGEQLMVGLGSPRAHAFDTATGPRALKL